MNRIDSIALLGWTTLSRKQIYQIEAYAELAREVFCLSNDSLGDSADTVHTVKQAGHKNVSLVLLGSGLLNKIIRTFLCLASAPGPQKIAILAPVGRLSMIYFVLARLFNFRVIVVEWGSIADLPKLSRLVAFNVRFCYRYAHAIWYKEPYMLNLLIPFRRVAQPGLYFIPNSAPALSPEALPDYQHRDIDFLWVNRMIDSRYPELMLNGLHALEQAGVQPKSVLMGLLQDQNFALKKQLDISKAASDNIEVLPYSNPLPYYRRAKFFVMIADHVFGNNSLLESMSFGVVPIVNQSCGIEIWLQNGVNAIIFDKDKDPLSVIFASLCAMDVGDWARLSAQAIHTAKTCSRLEDWKDRTRTMVENTLTKAMV